MRESMLGKILTLVVTVPAEWLGTLVDLLEKVTGAYGDEWFGELKKFLRKEKNWSVKVPELQATVPLLEFISTVVVPPLGKRFIAKEKFVVDTSRKAKVMVSYLDNNFKAWFFTGSGKVEEPIAVQMLRQMRLSRSSGDTPIIAELGGEEKSETTLSEMFYLMERQYDGRRGVLLNNGFTNIFYVRDVSGVLRAVRVFWSGGGWNVYARGVTSSSPWLHGPLVFSRN